jgi:hypothetical protein
MSLKPLSNHNQTNSDHLILVVILLLIAILAASVPLETDMWWHLRAGEETLQFGRPLLVDIFSYTRSGITWVNHSWLAQVVMFLCFKIGFLGLGLLVCSIATASMALTYLQMEGPAALRGFSLILVATVSAPVWAPRPQLFSLLLFGLVAYLLFLYKRRKRDHLLWLIPIFILWSNLHAGYVLGLILIGAAIAGEVMNHFLGNPDDTVLSYKQIIKLGLVALAAGVAVLLNPNGIKTWLIPFQTIGVQSLQNSIDEWASPDFHQLFQQPMLWLLLAILASVGLARHRWDGSDLITVLIFAYLALVARRNFGPFALAAGPILTRYMWDALDGWLYRVRPGLEAWRIRLKIPIIQNTDLSKTHPVWSRLINFSVVGLIGMVLCFRLYLTTDPGVVLSYEKMLYPVQAVSWIEQNHPRTNLMSSYGWGGYLIYSLRNYPVFVDGRTDLYNDDVIGQWQQVVNASPSWQPILDRWQVNTILLEPSRPLVDLLPLAGWKVLYRDEVAVILGR